MIWYVIFADDESMLGIIWKILFLINHTEFDRRDIKYHRLYIISRIIYWFQDYHNNIIAHAYYL